MLFDIKDILIKDCYIPQLQCLKYAYINNVQSFFADIDKKCAPLITAMKNKADKHKSHKYYCICDEPEYQMASNYEDLKYHYLSSALLSLVALWENQLSDLYLAKNCSDYNTLKQRLKEYYDLDTDSKIYEIRQIYNYLKHGPGGNSEQNLIKIKSHYLRNDRYNGELRGRYFRSKQLNITEYDITYFADTFINLWKKIYTKIEAMEQR